MLKTKFRRYAALLAVAALLTSAIGLTIGGTGAYLTANKSGSLNVSFATLAITTSGGSGTDGLDFTVGNILPGGTQTISLNVQNTGSATADVYMAFDNANGTWSAFNTLGNYGKFVIDGNVYDNLNNNSTNGAPPNPGIAGSPTGGTYCGGLLPQLPINYLPHIIYLGSLTPTASIAFNMSFTQSPCVTTTWPAFPPLNFKIAAFQPGIAPSNVLNGAGAIPALNLGAYGTYTQQ